MNNNIEGALRDRDFTERLLSCIPCGVMAVDAALQVLLVNQAMRALLGADEAAAGEPDAAFLTRYPALQDAVREAFRCAAGIERLEVECGAAAQAVEVQISAALQRDHGIVLVFAIEGKSPKLADEALRRGEHQFRLAFDQAAVGLGHIDADGVWLMVNQKLCDIIGYAQSDLIGVAQQDLTHPEDLPFDEDLCARLAKFDVVEYSQEKRYRHRNGQYVWVKFTVSLVRDEQGLPAYYAVVIEDISRHKQVEGALQHLANHDPLTGLPNRTLLLDRLAQGIAFARRFSGELAVLLIDLDRFKNINDSLGHQAGDRIIQEVAQRLKSRIRQGDTVARWGGDEFVVVLGDLSAGEIITNIAQKLLDALAQPVAIEGHELYPAGSIGISVYPRDGDDPHALLKNADTAMYRAKEAGRNNFQFYANEMNARALDRLKLESGLRRALLRDEFTLHYQPQMDLRSGRIIGVEALLRWQPPGQPMVMPGDFIPIAEETGVIVQIGEWVLRTACLQLKQWELDGGRQIKMAVNLSARQFKQHNIVKMVEQVLHETGCNPALLELEITESVVMDDPQTAAETLAQLSRMGVSLAIDDFGTGYSSLSYLKRFPIDALKIDRSFVRDITVDSDDAAIAKAVIALAHSMKLIVTAEGVETAGQLDFLKGQACDQMQGYYLSKPVPIGQIEQFLE